MLTITDGLFDGQVLQRNARSVSAATFAGRSNQTGSLWLAAWSAGKAVRGMGWRRVGAASGGKLRGTLRGLPVGGPYTLRLAIGGKPRAGADTLTIDDVWVGDVWILGGQSNMQGCGERESALPGISPVRAFYMHDRWAVARDPLHNLWNAVDPVHGGKPDGEDPGNKGVGPGVSFGQAMFAYTGVPQGLLACAHGGTSMAQWDPAHKKLGGYSLYGATVRRVRKNGGRVAGVVWYQGESDSMVRGLEEYLDRMRALIHAFRRDCGDARLPFALVQLSRYAGENQLPECWNGIQDLQRRLPQIVPNVATVPAIDLGLADLIHVDGHGQHVLGVRLAEALYALKQPKGELRPPIAVKRVTAGVDPGEQTATIHVEFDHVVGKLESHGRPMGFSVRRGAEHSPGVFDTRLDGHTVHLKTFRTLLDFVDKSLWYGWGLDPACTITDSAGRPLPVFGPLPITRRRLFTPFPKTLQVSAVLPGAGKLGAVELPATWESVGLAPRAVEYNFLNLNPELSKFKEDRLVFIVARVRCAEDMQLAALLGYDGPVKVWVDGVLKLHDPDGTNPAVPDCCPVKVAAPAGDHEITVALGSNAGKAWGIYLRVERIDIPQRLLDREPSRFRVPEWVE